MTVKFFDWLKKSGKADLNRRPQVPQTCTLTNCAIARNRSLIIVKTRKKVKRAVFSQVLKMVLFVTCPEHYCFNRILLRGKTRWLNKKNILRLKRRF